MHDTGVDTDARSVVSICPASGRWPGRSATQARARSAGSGGHRASGGRGGGAHPAVGPARCHGASAEQIERRWRWELVFRGLGARRPGPGLCRDAD